MLIAYAVISVYRIVLLVLGKSIYWFAVSQAIDYMLIDYMLIAAGIKAIWNFAPAHITVPDGVLVQNENMACSLALLSKHLNEMLGENDD